mmetsp:Transcript_27214/g.56996  ORF Transcript_27214/g.56996 Transcript_27214/m.56996 type:complete len:205 (-) Transcript_27214:690-1304(-)
MDTHDVSYRTKSSHRFCSTHVRVLLAACSVTCPTTAASSSFVPVFAIVFVGSCLRCLVSSCSRLRSRLLLRKRPVVRICRLPDLVQAGFPPGRKHVLCRPQGNALDAIGPNDLFRKGFLEVGRCGLHSGQRRRPVAAGIRIVRVFCCRCIAVSVVVSIQSCRSKCTRRCPHRHCRSTKLRRTLRFPRRPHLAVGNRLAVGQVQL